VTELNEALRNLELNKNIITARYERISQEGVLDSIGKFIDNIKNKIFDIIKIIRKDRKKIEEQFKESYDSKVEEVKVKGFIKSVDELLKSKDSNLKALDEKVLLDELIIKSILIEDGSVVNADYVLNRLKYLEKITNGSSKYFHDKKIAVSVIAGIIGSILKELSKESDVNYDKINNSFKEIQDTIDLGLISNMDLNFDKLTTIPKSIIKNKSLDYKTIDTDKSYQVYGSFGSLLILAKLTEPKDVIFPISIRLLDIERYGEGYIATVDELYELVKKYDAVSSDMNKLYLEIKESYADHILDITDSLLKDIDTLVKSSVYDDQARFNKDLDTINDLVRIAVHFRDSLTVDNNLLNTIFNLLNTFSVYITESIKHYE